MKMHQIAPFGLRMANDLKHELMKRADANKRSLNSELLVRLEESIKSEQKNAPTALTVGAPI